MPDECRQRVKEPGKGGAGRACKSCFEGCGICYCCSSSSVSYPELPPTARERERDRERGGERKERECVYMRLRLRERATKAVIGILFARCFVIVIVIVIVVVVGACDGP